MSPNRLALAVLGVALALVALLAWPERESAQSSGLQPRGAPVIRTEVAAELVTPESAEQRVQEASFAPRAEAEASEPTTEQETTLVIHARLVDAKRQPLAAGELSIPEFDLRAESDADGRVTLTANWVGDRPKFARDIKLCARAVGYATTFAVYTPTGEVETWLGDLVLNKAVVIQGRTIDASGNPVEGALVVASASLISDRARIHEYRRRSGPYAINFRPGATVQELAEEPFTALSDERGHFEIRDFSAAWAAVYAHRENAPWSFLSPVSMTESNGPIELELVLEELTSDEWIRGRVQDENENGLPGIQVSVSSESTTDERALSFSGMTDSTGRFAIWVPRDSSWTVQAYPREWELDSATLANVRAGSDEITLTLKESEWFWARVTDERGTPLTEGRVTGFNADRYEATGGDHPRPVERVVSDLWDAGRARLHIATERFYLQASAVGHASQTLGPYPAGWRKTVEFQLAAIPALRGVVTAEGVTVENAQVSLHARAPEHQEFVHDSWKGEGPPFSHDVSAHAFGLVVSTRTDGTFVIPIPRDTSHRVVPGQLTVQVEHPSLASTELGPFDSDKLEELEELSIELTAGGSVSGELRLQAPGSTAGWTIVAVNDSGQRTQQTVGDSGSFVLDRLRPGRWQIRAFHPTQRYRRSERLRDKQDRETEVLVVEGKTAQALIDVENTPPVQFSGRLVLRGHEPVEWRCIFRHPGGEVASTTTDKNGAFEVELLHAGEWSLTIVTMDSALEMFSFHDELFLAPGEASWEQKFDLGTVYLSRSQAQPPAEDVRWVLLQRGQGRLEVRSRIFLYNLSELPRRLFPAGKIDVLRSDRNGRPLDEIPLQTLELAKDAELKIELR